ncbi:class I SAM-dependent methyltransferase [Mycolicibacterium sp. XJ870]
MSAQDRDRWDATYADRVPREEVGPPSVFGPYSAVFPVAGTALDLACGPGLGSVWLAKRGLTVRGVDVSEVAVGQARALAERHDVAQRCRFDVVDLDDGLPAGPPVDVVLCHRFRDPRLYPAMAERLSPAGILAICALSEVGAAPGRFRARPGELPAVFAGLDVIAAGEGDGEAWLLARSPGEADEPVTRECAV